MDENLVNDSEISAFVVFISVVFFVQYNMVQK